MAGEIDKTIGFWFPFVRRTVVQASSTSDLLAKLGHCAQEVSRFELILVIAHSNRSGLQLTMDRFEAWRVFVNWIAPFCPKALAFVACEAGHPWPVEQLFKGLPTLREIYAPPLKTTKEQAQIIKLLIPVVLWKSKERCDVIKMLQTLHVIATNGWVFQWRRQEFEKCNVTQPTQWNLILELLRLGTAQT